MTAAPELPRGLEPWGEALAALEPAVAVSLLPMVRALETLFGRRPAALADSGEPDGYDGLATRGVPDRILMSEWLLADEAPMEFLRRAASGELLHLAQAYQRPKRVGRVVVLADNGPEQYGAPRLVQLAALIVLYRRARASGGELAVGLLGDEPGRWLAGDIGGVLHGWRAGRAPRQPGAGDVGRWYDALEPDDEAWVLTGPELAASLRQPRVAAVRTETWSPDGTATLRVVLGQESVELALPPADVAVRALRSASYRAAPAAVTAPGALRSPVFTAASGRLLMRGDGPGTLLSVAVADAPGERSTRLRRYEYRAPVVAAAHLGRRLVALVADDDDVLRAVVHGKPVTGLDDVAVPVAVAGLDAGELRRQADDAIAPLHLLGHELLVRLGGAWLALSADRARATPYVAVAPGQHLDQPLRVAATSSGLRVADGREVRGAPPDAQVVVGARHRVAWCGDGRTWQPVGKLAGWAPIVVDPRDEVLGLVPVDDEPHLVTRSPAGLLLRLAGAGGVRTLTHWSGSAEPPAVHPALPWVAVRRAPDVVEVGDLGSGRVLHVVRGGS